MPYRPKQIAILALSCLSILLELINPYLGKLIVDKAIVNKNFEIFIVYGLIGAALFISNGIIKAIAALLEKGMQLKVRFDLNKKLFSHLQALPLGFFKGSASGEHMYTLSYDIERSVDLIISVPKETVAILMKLVFILLIIFYLDWRMAVFSLVLAQVLYLPVGYFSRKMRSTWEDLIASSQNIFKRMEEIFSHMYLVKAMGRERHEVRAYLRALIGNLKIGLKNLRLEVLSNLTIGGFERVVIGGISLFGGLQVIRGNLSLGTLTAVMLYLSQLVSLQSGIGLFFQRISLGLISCRRLDELLRLAPEATELRGTEKIALRSPVIRFEKVSFKYNSQEHILKNLDFCFSGGLNVLVGPSGCGKTTIVNLILRLYRPGEGLVYGAEEEDEARQVDLSCLKRHIGAALQDPLLWNDTVENNIRYGSEQKVGFEEIKSVSKVSCADDFIENLPHGYQTIIGEKGCKISEGQKQRVAIARALLKRPAILLLDEAMSSMDTLSEEKIIANLRKISGLYTVIIVTHRLSTVMACDRVYFLKKPDTMVAEKPGTLIHNDKEFYDLFSAQISKSAFIS
ncbi:MAG: ABC transporter ATP-binding protein [Candidatus Omnitrophota bacterium]|nr:ABC transporter ATP-binding protein [Candidatus Omnitrophota bacterium]